MTKEMKTSIIPSLLGILFIMTFHSCKSPTAPKDNSQTDTIVKNSDTTSHSFSWEFYNFREERSGSLYDIAIIDENNIWAVGEIYLYDSTGQVDPLSYGFVHWDGHEWKTFRLQAPSPYGGTTNAQPRGILAFSSDDIWFAAGSIFHWDGKQLKLSLERYSYFNGNTHTESGQTVEKLWGTSDNNIYGVGDKGVIVHYDGKKWEKLNSGTTMQIYDIYGATDPNTGKEEILAVGGNNYPPEHIILSISGTTVKPISLKPIQWELFSLWFIPNQHYYVVGDGIFEKNLLSDSLWSNGQFDLTRKASSGICANGLNDVFITGAYGEVLHYNGSTWKSYINETGFDGSFRKADVKGDLIAVAGSTDRQGVILIGRRK